MVAYAGTRSCGPKYRRNTPGGPPCGWLKHRPSGWQKICHGSRGPNLGPSRQAPSARCRCCWKFSMRHSTVAVCAPRYKCPSVEPDPKMAEAAFACAIMGDPSEASRCRFALRSPASLPPPRRGDTWEDGEKPCAKAAGAAAGSAGSGAAAGASGAAAKAAGGAATPSSGRPAAPEADEHAAAAIGAGVTWRGGPSPRSLRALPSIAMTPAEGRSGL
mmetsp:Transcript_97576/g.172771  ORF Transcript_97576/g.172771 Transcript_97576/m.172771 type:complete len:217 (+) Transcript_97576:960-1610(+)